MATPGSHTPLIIPPFLTALFRSLLPNVCFPTCFSLQMVPEAFLPAPQSLGAHAAHPNFWDPGRSRQNHKTVLRSPTATESQKWSRTLALAAHMDVKSRLFDSSGNRFPDQNCDRGPLLRTHYLLCFLSKKPISSRRETHFGTLCVLCAIFFCFF